MSSNKNAINQGSNISYAQQLCSFPRLTAASFFDLVSFLSLTFLQLIIFTVLQLYFSAKKSREVFILRVKNTAKYKNQEVYIDRVSYFSSIPKTMFQILPCEIQIFEP